MKSPESLDRGAPRRAPAAERDPVRSPTAAGTTPATARPTVTDRLHHSPRMVAQRARIATSFGPAARLEAAPREDGGQTTSVSPHPVQLHGQAASPGRRGARRGPPALQRVEGVRFGGPEVLRGDLRELCRTGEAIAWDLYRAQLQLIVDETHAEQGRMSAFGPGTAGLAQAQQQRTRAEQAFQALAAEGDRVADAEGAEPGRAEAELASLLDETRAALRRIGDLAFRVGVKAEEDTGHIIAARHAFKAADRAEGAADERTRITVQELRQGTARGSAVEAVYSDAIDTGANTLVGGTAGNVMGGFGAVAAEGTTAFNVGFGAGAVFGPLAIMCSSIDLALNIKSAVTTAERRRQMGELSRTLASSQAREVAAYAADQKTKKLGRRVALSGAAAAGLAAGIAACVALGVATFGVGALAIAVIASAIGIGFLVYKMVRSSKWARKRKLGDLAAHLSQTALDPSDAEAQQLALHQIQANLGIGDVQDVEAIKGRLLEIGMSRRDATAEWLVLLLVDGTRSERRDAELVLEGLKLKPKKLRGLVENDQGNQAIDLVKGKLSSW